MNKEGWGKTREILNCKVGGGYYQNSCQQYAWSKFI